MANREENNFQKSSVQHNKRQNIQTSQHTFHKRQPRKFEQGENILYVSTKTNTKAHLEHFNKIIRNKDVNEVIIYCLGAAIQRGILLALQICEEHVAFNIETTTFSTELIDDLEPAADDADYEIQKRFNSALRIRVFCKDLLDVSSKQEK